MQIYKAKRGVGFSKFVDENAELEAKYGLPREVMFCKKCVISNQRPNSTVEYQHNKNSQKETIHFDKDCICDACKYTGRKNESIDWKEREESLKDLCDQFRKNDGSFDCLVPGSGGKDSFYASHILKYKYNMHPLTVTWAPHMYTDWGWKNFQSWIHAGFDNILFTPNGRIHRLLTRLAVENLFHPFQPFIIGQKALAPKLAAKFKIPLIFFGENEAEYGNPIEDNESARRSWQYYSSEDKSSIFLGGTSIEDLTKYFGVSAVDLDAYMPINPEIIDSLGLQVHYLGYYLKWHPQSNYYYSVENGNFQASPERTPGTYSKYNSIDDKIDDLHYYTTYIKFGIGRATYDAAQEIRSGDITREEGIALIRRYDGEFPERFIDELLAYLSLPANEFPEASKRFEKPIMDREYFDNIADSFRSPHLWNFKNNKWELRYNIWEVASSSTINQEEEALNWKGNVY